ncbi:translation initiation factor eIF3 subunit [Tilletiopsis washingtonensis]|uniref:Eukaryotic translation initiation factor 3 30 kDa subunit n=1 Tax=Tilletiopsis washingtonensis TaxID=58919 RepID=A0A316ZD49_9BASI|nr:translation initiation factor eIF3 subunit [Tilletiopsis washingtonensis]PWN99707.1 translation initiation factor eIF3 subunit [Tilletiopsis washingtonensis]
MSDWDQDSDDGVAPAAPAKPVVLPPRRGGKFDDEDVEEEVKDDWEEEDEAPAPAPVVAPPKKKGTVKQKIAEKEAEERRRAELGVESDEDVPEEDAAARRRAERDAQIKADLDNAANLLGTAKIAVTDDSSSLRNAKPASKEDWESFASELYTTMIRKQASRPGFDKHFVPFLCGLLASEGLRDVDMRKLSTRWKELADEKVKNDKEAKRLGGKKPAAAAAKPKSVGTSSAKNVIDTRAYGDEALDDGDDLDFM